MSDMSFGITLTADGRQLVTEVNKSSESLDRLSASARGASGEAVKLNGSQGDFADQMNKTQVQSERLNTSLNNQSSALNQAALAMRQSAAANNETSESITRLLDRYDAQGAKVRKLRADFNTLSHAAMSGEIGQKDDARVDKVYASIQNEIGGATGAVKNFSVAANESMKSTAHASAGVTRELIVMGHEAMNGNFSRMPGSLMVLAERMNWMMGPIALVTGALYAGYEAWKLWGQSAVEVEVINKTAHDVATNTIDDLNKQITLIDTRNRLLKQGISGDDKSTTALGNLNSMIETEQYAMAHKAKGSVGYENDVKKLRELIPERDRLIESMKMEKAAQAELNKTKEGNSEQKKTEEWLASERAKIDMMNVEAATGVKLVEAQKALFDLNEKQKSPATALTESDFTKKQTGLADLAAQQIDARDTAAANKAAAAEKERFDTLIKSANDRIAVMKLQIGSTETLSESQKILAQFDQQVADGTTRLAADQIAQTRATYAQAVAYEDNQNKLKKLQSQYETGFKSTLNNVFEPNANMLDVAGKNFGLSLKKSIKETFTSGIFDSTLKGFSDHLAGSMSAVFGQMGGGKKALPSDWISASLAAAAAASIAFAPQATAMQLNLANASYVQQFQGTGSVTGEAMTQSHSISDSLKLLSSTATTGNTYTQQMLMHLKSVDLSMSSFVTAAAKSIGMDIASTMGIARASDTNSANGLLGGYMTNGPLGAAMGNSPFMQSVIGAVFGKSTTAVTDSGLNINGTLGGLAQGKGVSTYVSGTNTSSGLFGTGIGGSSSTFTNTSAASADLSSSFASIYSGIAASFKSAGKAMGMDVSTIDTTFKNFQTTIGNLSFEGLNATQKYAALDAAISKDADLLARQLFPSMVQFNVAGEGMDKTVIRVIAENASVVTELNAMGSAAVKAGSSTYQLTNSLVMAAGSLDTLMTSMQSFSKFYTTSAAQQNTLYASAKNQFSGTPLDGLINAKTTATQMAAYVNAAMTSGIDSNTKVQILNAANSFSQFLTSVQAGIDQLKSSYDAVISSRDAVVGSIKNLQLFNVTMQDFRRQVVTDNSMANPVAKYSDAKKYFDDIAAKAAAGDSIAQSKLQAASQQLLSTSMTASGSYTQYQRDYNSVLAAVDNTMSYNDTMIKSGQDMLSALDTQNNISAAIQANTFDTRVQTIELAKNLNGYAVASTQYALQASVASDAAKTALTDYISKNDANMTTLIGGVTTSVGGVTTAISTVKDILANQPALLASVVTADQTAITAATAAALNAIAKTAIPAIQIAVTQAATAATSGSSSSGQSGGGIGNQVASAVNHVGDVVAQVFGWSDPRLKENITQVGKTKYGLNLYDFNYLGESQRYRGVMSTEVRRVMPSAVTSHNGFDAVNYGMLGLKMTKIGGSFEVGSNYIPHDMVAQVHSGEEITPKPFVDLQRAARDETNSLLARLVSTQIEMKNQLARLTDNQKRDNASLKDSSQRTADLLDMISANGGPLEVKVVTA